MGQKLISLGAILRPHGLKGEVDVHLHSGQDTILIPGMEVTAPTQKLIVEAVHKKTAKIRLKFKDIDERGFWEKAGLPWEIKMDRKDFPNVKDQYYLIDFEGLKLLDENKNEVGKILATDSHHGQPYFKVLLKNAKTYELPFVAAFFPAFNIKEGWVSWVEPEEIE
jgi:ribosomal 30S subunit maturation factor RimM